MPDAVTYCAFCLPNNQLEPRWVVEVMGPDGTTDQRLAACDECAGETLGLMRREYPQAASGAYSVLRRMMPTDAILTFHTIGD